jgi:VWFA-related protein
VAQSPADFGTTVEEVRVTVSVTDRNGAAVRHLKREDFALLDNGEAREITSFWQEIDLPLTIGLIGDVSTSQAGKIDEHREAVGTFLKKVMGPQDQAFLISVGHREVRLIKDLTNSVEQLSADVGKLRMRYDEGIVIGQPCTLSAGRLMKGGCGTVLWEGVYAAAREKMKSVNGRKALIVLSDGIDVGSPHGVNDAIEAAQSADTPVYAIRYLSALQKYHPVLRLRASLSKGMGRIAEETGGRQYPAPKDSTAVFAEIENDLRTKYALGFRPPAAARDGKFRKIEVKLRNKDLHARARSGYRIPNTTAVQ